MVQGSWQGEGDTGDRVQSVLVIIRDCRAALDNTIIDATILFSVTIIMSQFDLLTFHFVGTTIVSEAKMAYVRAKHRGQRVYYYLVESKREGNKIRQRIIRYLGTKPPTEEELENILKEVNR